MDALLRTDAPAAAVHAMRLQFVSYEQMLEAIRDAQIEAHIVSREVRPWLMRRYTLGDCLVQHGLDGAPHVASGSLDPGRVGFYMAGYSTALRLCNGLELDSGSLFRWGQGADIHVQVRRPGEWMAISATPEAVGHIAASLTGSDKEVGRLTSGLADASPAGVTELRRLFEAAERAIDAAGPTGLPAEAARHLGETLLRSAIAVFSGGRESPRRARRQRVDRGRIVARVEDLFAASASEPVYVSSLSDALGIPERTLRHVFDEQYGASPVHVLRSRRLCQARRALAAAGEGAHVGEIAGRFGFWHLGQFAAEYRKLFGERPSETLGRNGAPGRGGAGRSRRPSCRRRGRSTLRGGAAQPAAPPGAGSGSGPGPSSPASSSG